MATTPKHEEVAAALLTALRKIGSTPDYWYGPYETFRVRYYHPSYFQQTREGFVMLRSGTASWTREMNCEWLIEREFFVLFCHRDSNSVKSPWTAEPSDGGALPTTAQERMLGDVEEALKDDSLGGVSDQVDIVSVEYGFDATPWTAVEVSLLVTYMAPRRTTN